VRGYLTNGGPFPGRLHIISLLSIFYASFAESMLDWCDLAESEIRTWPRTSNVGLTQVTRQHLEDIVKRYEKRVSR
jgi:hypothetical protein